MDDQLLNLFAGLESATDIRSRFVTTRHAETNHIEFKEKSDTRTPELSEHDRRNFAKTLSSLSNAEGGILIWGIRTRRREGRDYASVLKPIKQAEAFAERLRDSLIDVLMPQNPGIRIEAVTNRLGNGYVKCFIPPSDNPPHRSMVDREYWVRLDGRSVKMEHYLIRDMMARRASPDLNLDIVPDFANVPSGQARLVFILHNAGRAVAKHSGWFALFENARVVTCDHGCGDCTAVNSGRPSAVWNAQMGTVIHPNDIRSRVGWVHVEPTDNRLPIQAQVAWYCEDMTVKNRVFSIDIPVANESATSEDVSD